MVEEIRSMWCDTLEELLQCPVCLETKDNNQKLQCINGHHICIICKQQLTTCPICKSYFINTRNLTVEQLTAKLKEIKASLLNPYHELNRRILKNKVCVSTQTENIYVPSISTACQTEYAVKENGSVQQTMILSPKVGKGLYPCRIGACTMLLPHGRIIGHLRNFHKNTFYEFSTKRSTIFNQTWSLQYNPNQKYDFAFFIKGMGLFFLNISIHRRGDLSAIVQIVNCKDVAKQFTYTLETGNGPQKICYTGVVKSCRVRRESLSEDCLYVREDNMRRIINRNNFHCHLIINRRMDYRVTAGKDNSMQLFEVPTNH